ncbi:MAG: penicillin acylase family protein [Chitinophagaceae bacterium]
MKYLFLLFLPAGVWAQQSQPSTVAAWEKQAKRVTIYRDNWGIPHIYGQSDADAVFGLLYAQCEDDFPRVEMNYIEKLGRLAEVKGKSFLYEDLLMRLLIDPAEAQEDYRKSPQWLKQLCRAFADAINYYLYKHPEVRPRLLTHFEPWYPLLWTDGSIGAINTAGLTAADVAQYYGKEQPSAFKKTIPNLPSEKVTGSNGFAFAPGITASGNAILYINPHVTFYFRPEVHMVSQEGLNAYGAVTWGQFFIYQGFNEFCGWMHTSSEVDAADLYQETLDNKAGLWQYEYENSWRPVQEKNIALHYIEKGESITQQFTTLATHHGPILARRGDKYLSLRADNRIAAGLIQCWKRTKTKSFQSFQQNLELKGNISNNTVYADAAGNIAYWHGNRIPVRDPQINWANPVDGTTARTEWKGLHPISEIVHLFNPQNGWLQNCNSTPFTVAGPNSPKSSDFPSYMAPDEENFRGLNAVRVLSKEKKYSIDQVIRAGYDTYLIAFEILIPALIKAFEEQVSPKDTSFAYWAGPIAVLKNWDFRSGENSIATTLAVEWGERILPDLLRNPEYGTSETGIVEKVSNYATTATPQKLLQALQETLTGLHQRFGRWQLPWGEINRFQRINPNLENKFDDAQASIPVGFVSSFWGMLPSYSSHPYPGTQKRYGVNGNSFVCAVEFGKKIKAKSLLAGGESGHPGSAHFFDQALPYSKGQFKEVYFYKEDVIQHAEQTYHPGF